MVESGHLWGEDDKPTDIRPSAFRRKIIRVK